MLKGPFLKRICLFTIIFFVWACFPDKALSSQTHIREADQKASPNKYHSKETDASPRVKVKEGERRERKKFPWLFVAAGAVVAGVIVVLLLKKKRDSKVEEWQNTGTVDSDYDTDVLGIEWVKIPAGEFLMGDNFNESSSFNMPVHPVFLDSYCISKFEVTFEQYERFCQERGWSVPYDQGWGMMRHSPE